MLEIKGLRTEFIRYLEENTGDPHPRAAAKNALFPYYHDIGMPFEAILKDEASMAEAQSLLAVHFGRVGRAEPEQAAAAVHDCLVKFRAFLEASNRLSLLEAPEQTPE